jgi:hypothetical protein
VSRALLAVCLAVPAALGCAAKAGPLRIAVGQAEICDGGYAYSDAAGWRCQGDYVAGGALSDTLASIVHDVQDLAIGVLGGQPPARSTETNQ